MPIELKKKTAAPADETAPEAKKGLTLFNEDGELTLPGETIADFLETCDFTPVMESEDAQPFLVLAEEGDEEAGDDAEDADGGEEEGDEPADDEEETDDTGADADEAVDVILPGIVAASLVDEGDLVEMFGFYLSRLSEEIEESDEQMLQERATLACFNAYLDDDGNIDEDSVSEVATMLRDVLSNSIVEGELSEKFLTKGARMKVARIRKKPKSGKRRMELKKRRREEGRGAKKAKINRQKKMFKRKRASRIKMLARESADEAVLVFGYGEGIDGANFKVALAETPSFDFDADTIEVLETQIGLTATCPNEDCGHTAVFSSFLDEKKKGKMPDAFKKKMKGKKDDDGDEDGSEKGEKCEAVELHCPECDHTFAYADESEPEAKKPKANESHKPSGYSPFAVTPGRPSLNEGASLAGSTLGAMGIGRRTLTEDDED